MKRGIDIAGKFGIGVTLCLCLSGCGLTTKLSEPFKAALKSEVELKRAEAHAALDSHIDRLIDKAIGEALAPPPPVSANPATITVKTQTEK